MSIISINVWNRQLLALEAKLPHDLKAQAESAVLVAIALPRAERS